MKLMSVMLAALMALSLCSTAFAADESPEIKNVIIMIGDGMGENHLEMAKQKEGTALAMDTFPYKGQSMTRSFSSKVTDSAAGATALACGVRTNNGCVSVFPLDPLGAFVIPTSITEAAMKNGLRTGVITTDSTTGATPAGFSAHTSSRGNGRTIAYQQMASGIDLIWGHSEDYIDAGTSTKNGYTYIATLEEMNALENGSKSFGQFADDCWSRTPESETTPTLAEMTESAIRILDNDDEGFFLMVEGAHIDKNSHGNKAYGMVDALYGFDNAVRVALDFAAEDGETVVIVTADHETGAIKEIDGEYKFTSGSHSGVNVPLRVYGTDKIIENGQVINNKEVPLLASRVLGIESDFTQIGYGLIPRTFYKILSFLDIK